MRSYQCQPRPATADVIAPALNAIGNDARAAWKARGWPQTDRHGRALPCPLHFIRDTKLQRLCGRILADVRSMSPLDYPLAGHLWAGGIVLMLTGHVELIERPGGRYFLALIGGLR